MCRRACPRGLSALNLADRVGEQPWDDCSFGVYAVYHTRLTLSLGPICALFSFHRCSRAAYHTGIHSTVFLDQSPPRTRSSVSHPPMPPPVRAASLGLLAGAPGDLDTVLFRLSASLLNEHSPRFNSQVRRLAQSCSPAHSCKPSSGCPVTGEAAPVLASLHIGQTSSLRIARRDLPLHPLS